MLQSFVQQFAAHGTVGYTQGEPHRATLSGELMAVMPQVIGGDVAESPLSILSIKLLCSYRGGNDSQSLLARVNRACPLGNCHQNIKKTYQLASTITLHSI
jgi:hypothetical protein